MKCISGFKKRYFQVTEKERLGGTDVLEELSQEAFKILKKSPPKHILPLFILFKVFHDISIDQERRMVELKEARQLYNRLNKWITKLLEDLESDKKQEILLRDTANLIKNYYL